MYNCNRIVVIGVGKLNPMNLWQIQVLLGTVTAVACFKTIEECPALPQETGVLFLTDRKPTVDQVQHFGRVFHAPLRPTSVPELTLSELDRDGSRQAWTSRHAVCLPSKRQSPPANLATQQPKPKPQQQRRHHSVPRGLAFA